MTEQEGTLLMPSVAYDGKIKINAYPCEALPIFCSAIIKARRLKLIKRQFHTRMFIIAEQCEIIQSSLAKVGITFLIDEATGFQYDRKHDALRLLLNRYLEDEARKWLKELPDVFSML